MSAAAARAVQRQHGGVIGRQAQAHGGRGGEATVRNAAAQPSPTQRKKKSPPRAPPRTSRQQCARLLAGPYSWQGPQGGAGQGSSSIAEQPSRHSTVAAQSSAAWAGGWVMAPRRPLWEHASSPCCPHGFLSLFPPPLRAIKARIPASPCSPSFRFCLLSSPPPPPPAGHHPQGPHPGRGLQRLQQRAGAHADAGQERHRAGEGCVHGGGRGGVGVEGGGGCSDTGCIPWVFSAGQLPTGGRAAVAAATLGWLEQSVVGC